MIDIFGIQISLDPSLAMVLGAVFFGGFVRGFTGFGSALVIVPALAFIFSPQQAVAMHAIMEIPVILSLIPAAVRHAERSVVIPMLVALVITTPIGALVLKHFDQDLLRVLISFVVLAMVGLLAADKYVAARLGSRGTTVAGAVGGIFQGATGIGGPPVVTALLAHGGDATTTRANVIAVMSSLVAVSLVTFWLYGFVSQKVLTVGALTAPVCFIATLLGMSAFRRYGDRSHRGVALSVLAATALFTLYASLASSP